MNRLIENLDRKKFEMLRNFIQTPDRHYLDTLGSSQKNDKNKQDDEGRQEEI